MNGPPCPTKCKAAAVRRATKAWRPAPAVEARLGRLEDAVDEIRAELKTIRADMASIRQELAEMRGEMRGRFANLPTTFQLIYMQGGFVLAIFAAAFALLRYAPPH